MLKHILTLPRTDSVSDIRSENTSFISAGRPSVEKAGVAWTRRAWRLVCLITMLLLSACVTDTEETAKPGEKIQYKPATFQDLVGWAEDDQVQVLGALKRSCPGLARRGAGIHGTADDWKAICSLINELGNSPESVREFFERHFTVVQVTDGAGNEEGLMTGYFEPELRGSRIRDETYRFPLYRRPPELVKADLSLFSRQWKGKSIIGHVKNGALVPYFTRRDLDKGALDEKGLEMFWVDSAVDSFFLHIQGSGRVRLQDGSYQRVGYHGSNGQPYFAIGRVLIANGEIPREEMSMQAIRKWLRDNPQSADDLMWRNPSYVFFRELTGEGPIGTEGVPLSAGRSIAVDRRLIPLGIPIWIDTHMPGEETIPLRRLTVAQDTGGAIRGAVRGDLFWGTGDDAGEMAGKMVSRLRYWILRPISLQKS